MQPLATSVAIHHFETARAEATLRHRGATVTTSGLNANKRKRHGLPHKQIKQPLSSKKPRGFETKSLLVHRNACAQLDFHFDIPHAISSSGMIARKLPAQAAHYNFEGPSVIFRCGIIRLRSGPERQATQMAHDG